MNNECVRIKCTCGAIIDTKVIKESKGLKSERDFMVEHIEHMNKGKKYNEYRIKYNGKLESIEMCDVFDEEDTMKQVKELMKNSEPDDIITIENVAKNLNKN